MSDSESLRAVLERTARRINERNSDVTATYQFVIDRPNGRDDYRLVIIDGRCELLSGEGEATSTVITTPHRRDMEPRSGGGTGRGARC